MYKIIYNRRFVSDSKAFKNDKPLRILIQGRIMDIVSAPEDGEPLTGNMDGIRKWKFNNKSTQYRILYRLYRCCGSPDTNANCIIAQDTEVGPPECQGLIHFLHVQSREDCNHLYGQKKKYFDETFLDDMDLME